MGHFKLTSQHSTCLQSRLPRSESPRATRKRASSGRGSPTQKAKGAEEEGAAREGPKSGLAPEAEAREAEALRPARGPLEGWGAATSSELPLIRAIRYPPALARQTAKAIHSRPDSLKQVAPTHASTHGASTIEGVKPQRQQGIQQEGRASGPREGRVKPGKSTVAIESIQ